MAMPKVGGFVLVAVSSLTAGLSWPISKIALSEIDPWTFKAITVIGSGLLLLAMTRAAGHSTKPSRRDLISLALIAVFNISLWHLLVAFGLRASAASHAVIIAFTMPIWATLLSVWLLAERIRIQSVLASVLVFGSIVVLVGADLDDVADGTIGPVLLLLAAMSWAYGTIRQKQLTTALSLTAVAGWQLLIGSAPIALGMIAWGSPGDLVTVSSAAAAATSFVLAAMILIYWAWFRIVQVFPAHVASISKVATPVIGVVASGLILNEALGLREWGALALMVAGLPLLTLQRWQGVTSPRSRRTA